MFVEWMAAESLDGVLRALCSLPRAEPLPGCLGGQDGELPSQLKLSIAIVNLGDLAIVIYRGANPLRSSPDYSPIP